MIRIEEIEAIKRMKRFESCPFIQQGITCSECGMITRPCAIIRGGIYDVREETGVGEAIGGKH